MSNTNVNQLKKIKNVGLKLLLELIEDKEAKLDHRLKAIEIILEHSAFTVPIEEHSKSDLHNGFHMESWVKLSTNRIDGKTNIYSTNDLLGFTGAIMVLFGDAENNIIHHTRVYSGGVNGVRTGDPSRDLYWNEGVPQDVVERTTKLEIIHVRNPHGRIEENLDSAIRIAEKIERLAEHIKNAMQDFGELVDL
ncbi:hypothetical protein [Bacillus safensis]|uniref:hypothetical protein n=1 Tax=Bacillus safensis TaxID=561879 RepID=UPI0030004132